MPEFKTNSFCIDFAKIQFRKDIAGNAITSWYAADLHVVFRPPFDKPFSRPDLQLQISCDAANLEKLTNGLRSIIEKWRAAPPSRDITISESLFWMNPHFDVLLEFFDNAVAERQGNQDVVVKLWINTSSWGIKTESQEYIGLYSTANSHDLLSWVDDLERYLSSSPLQ